MQIALTSIPNLYAVWDEKIEDYWFTGTKDECEEWILKHTNNICCPQYS